MSFSNIKSIFKIALLSTSLFISSQVYAMDMSGPVPPIPGLNVPLEAAPPVKHKKSKKKKKHKKNKNKKKKGQKQLIQSPEKKAEKTIDDCRKLLAAPAPEKEAKRKARKRKRCEELMTKEGIPTNPPATAPASETVTVTPATGEGEVAPVEAPVSTEVAAVPIEAVPAIDAAAPAPESEAQATAEPAPGEGAEPPAA